MNAVLAILRRFSLGGVVILILSFVLKGGLPVAGYLRLFLMGSPLLYLLFVFFSWLSAKRTTGKLSQQFGVDIPSNNYITTLLRSIFIDAVSPIGVIIDLFKDSRMKTVMFVATYFIVAVYVYLWFFVL